MKVILITVFSLLSISLTTLFCQVKKVDIEKYYTLGQEQYDKLNYKQAIIAYEKVINALKDIPHDGLDYIKYKYTYGSLAFCYEAVNNFNKALENYNEMFAIEKNKYFKDKILRHQMFVENQKLGWKTFINKSDCPVEGEGKYFFYNQQKLKKKNNKIQIWIKVVDFGIEAPTTKEQMNQAFEEKVTDEIEDLAQVKFPYHLQLWEYDCSTQRQRLLQYVSYGADGKLTDSGSNDDDKWSAIIPGSVSEEMLAVICK